MVLQISKGMIFLIAFSLFSTDTISSIRNQLNKKEYKSAYQAANSKILHEGHIDADHILFFLRGYASIQLGKYNEGISDLSRFLSSGINFNPKDKLDSYSLRCTAYLKTGKIEEAFNDANKIQDEKLIKLVTRANSLHLTATSNESSPRFSLNKYVELIKICPFSEDFLNKAAEIALTIGDHDLFIEFSQKSLKISPKNPKILEIIGKYHFSQLELKKAEEYAKKCIKSLSDSSNCTIMLKSINNFQKNEKKAINLISKKKFNQAKQFIEICQSIVKKYSNDDSPLANQINKINVKILIANDEKEEAIECLNGLIKAFPKNNEFFVQRGMLLLDFNDFSGAISDFLVVKKRTKSESIENKEVVKFIEKASQLQEKEKNMNYYTVMGLDSKASLNDIKNAYKKLVVMWHPDRFNKPMKKKEAEKKMMMINKAYDVLSDDTKKKLYDFDIEYERATKRYSNQQQKNKNFKNINNNKKNNNKKSEKMGKELTDEFRNPGIELKKMEDELDNLGNDLNNLEIEVNSFANGLKNTYNKKY